MIMNPLVIVGGGTNKQTHQRRTRKVCKGADRGNQELRRRGAGSQSSCSGEEEEEPELLPELHCSVLQSALGLGALLP